MEKVLVVDSRTSKKYIVNLEDIKEGYRFHSDCAFDCFFNDLEDYNEWKKQQEIDEDRYAVPDEYISEQGKDFGAFPVEEALTMEEIKELYDSYNYYWNSYRDEVIEISKITDLEDHLENYIWAKPVKYIIIPMPKYDKQIYINIDEYVTDLTK